MYEYFNIFDLMPQFSLSLEELNKRYLSLQQLNHPDNFINDDMKKKEAINKITKINIAYEVLKSPIKRAEYLATCMNLNITDSISSNILMESMELNEIIATTEDSKKVLEMIREKISCCVNELEQAFVNSDKNGIADGVMRLKYLNRSLEGAL